MWKSGELWVKIHNFVYYFISMRFTGTLEAKLDAKGRVFFPATFRKTMSEGCGEFVLRKDVYQPCLVVYPQLVWERTVETLRQRLNVWNPKEAMVLRQFLAEAESVSLDASGRFILSKRMQKMAGIDKALVFVGMDDRIEIWSKSNVEEPFLSNEEFGAALENIMAADND